MNKFLKIVVIILIVFLHSKRVVAQSNTDTRLAAQYYSNKEYDKALVYYQKLFDKNKTEKYYSRLLNCLTKLEDYKSAEKLIKRQLKRDSYALKFYVDLGYLYEVSEQENKAKQAYEKGIKLLTPRISR